mmetsp:Transcript_28664/g.52189  ORF Transcript_28664/g.52189 Transcript_28664/m.52189 type:complete len:257 (-) Transcript_28664:414-1184(-)
MIQLLQHIKFVPNLLRRDLSVHGNLLAYAALLGLPMCDPRALTKVAAATRLGYLIFLFDALGVVGDELVFSYFHLAILVSDSAEQLDKHGKEGLQVDGLWQDLGAFWELLSQYCPKHGQVHVWNVPVRQDVRHLLSGQRSHHGAVRGLCWHAEVLINTSCHAPIGVHGGQGHSYPLHEALHICRAWQTVITKQLRTDNGLHTLRLRSECSKAPRLRLAGLCPSRSSRLYLTRGSASTPRRAGGGCSWPGASGAQRP